MNMRELVINSLLCIDRVFLEDEYYDEKHSETLDEYLEHEESILYNEYNEKSDSELLIDLLESHADINFDYLKSYIKNF